MYRKSNKGWAKHLDFMMFDLLCLYVSFFAVYIVRHRAMFSFQSRLYRNMIFVLLFTQVLVSLINDTFKNVMKRGYYQELRVTVRHVLLITLITSFYLFLTQEGSDYSRSILVMTGICDIFISYIVRSWWKSYVRRKGLQGKDRSMLILTSRTMIDTVINNIRLNNYDRFKITGIALVDADWIGREIEGIKIVANIDTVVEYVCREWVDEIFINVPKGMVIPDELIQEFNEMGITTHVKLMHFSETAGKKQNVERLGSYTVLTSSINMASIKELFLKRTLDILGGLVGCTITGILFLFVAPAIYIQSPGPIFFSQIRVGKNGRKFKIYKFRSMYMDAEERKKELMKQNRIEGGLMFKMENDPRIIGGEKGIGGIIRKFSIDEFPQFWNVLKGDMSLVGTRPPTVDEWEKYDLHHRVRLAIKPGITGMWQVSGRSDITDFEEVVRLDREYITNWSIGLDIKILIKTVLVVLDRKGSM